LPEGEIIEGVAAGGIGDFEIDRGVEVGCVPQVRGKHGEGVLRGMPAFFDRFERIDGKGMAQAMGSGWIEDNIAELFSWLSDPDLSNGIVEEEPHFLIRDRVEVFAGQEIWILILGVEVCPNGEIVVHLLHDGLGNRDQSIFSELGFFDVEGALFLSIVVLEQVQGFGDSQAASNHEQDGHIHGELSEKGCIRSFHSLADGFEEVLGLLGREDEGDRNLFFERGDVEERIFLKDPLTNEETKEAPCD